MVSVSRMVRVSLALGTTSRWSGSGGWRAIERWLVGMAVGGMVKWLLLPLKERKKEKKKEKKES